MVAEHTLGSGSGSLFRPGIKTSWKLLSHVWTTSRTLKLKTGASFVVIDLAKANNGDDYVVRLDDGRTGWAYTSSPFLLDYDPVARVKAAQEECARRGQPRVGISRDELIETCWRKPTRIVKRTTAAGVEETYVYGAAMQSNLLTARSPRLWKHNNSADVRVGS